MRKMAKSKTSGKPKRSARPSFVPHEPSRSPELTDTKLVREILLESLAANDLETFQDVLVGYLRAASKLSLSRKTRLGRTTLYDLIDPEKPFNPTLETLGKIFESLQAA